MAKDFNRQGVQIATATISLDELVHGVPLEVMSMPPNSVVLSGQFVTTEAWNSTTSDKMSLGDATLATRYLTDGNIRALNARVPIVPTGFVGTGEPLSVIWTSGGGVPTTGEVRLEVEYYIIGRAETTIG